MRTSQMFSGALAVAFSILHGVSAQTSGNYTDPDTGITFGTTTVSDSETTGGFTLGLALPPNADTVSSTEYIGLMIGAINNGTGWSGISHAGGMPSSLLLMGWANGDEILTSFRYATGYVAPDIYTGNATLSPISSSVNSTHWTLIYRCQDCFDWNQNGTTGSQSTTGSVLVIGWAQSFASPDDPTNPDSTIVEHDNGYDIFGASVAPALQPSYSSWVSLATATPTTTATGTATATATTTASYSSTPVPTTTYDYVVVGGGAGGITIADKLSESGASVLLIERGPPSSGRWGGDLKPAWLDGTNLTRFDVPGLCNEIWADSAGISCPDVSQMSGCVLGGGTAVNAGLWWKPFTLDWDYNFPKGWQSSDMSAATDRVFSRIPGTDHPSADGILYLQQGFDVISDGLSNAGWTSVVANNVPNEKNRTFAHTPFMYSHGERGGPMATYLVTASARSNFKLWTNTTVSKVIRTAGHATGVVVEAYGDGGYKGIVNITATSGRVILSAGAFGTAKVLLRSGIGPADQLAIVNASSDGPSMISSHEWIDLPVGENLDDHVNTDTVISHPNVTFYDFYAAYNAPIASDKNAYLDNRTHILTQAAPNIGPMFWEEITGADGIVRQLQWTARCEGSLGAPNNMSMTLSQYLGRGAVSRGRATITSSLDMTVSTVPYLHDENDLAAVITGVEHLVEALKTVDGLTWLYPNENETATDYVNNIPVTTAFRTANHWIGTAKIGTDDGRSGGTSVVDLNTKVYGTDNIFVVDASIFPGEPSTNPSAPIVIAAERASELILALEAPAVIARYQQCGGVDYDGSAVCAAGSVCTWQNAEYSQCI